MERGYELDENLALSDLGVSAYTSDNVMRGAMAGFLAAGAGTAATTAQTADTPPLRDRAPGARKTEADVRGRLVTAEEDLPQDRANGVRPVR